jgi:hypothetical protein
MKSILKHVPKPSSLLFAMIKGLEKQSKRKDFQVDMGTFGVARHRRGKPICFGCAATCTIQQIAGKNLNHSHIEYPVDRAKVLGFHDEELNRFESYVDSLRRGQNQDYHLSTTEVLEEVYDQSLPEPIIPLKELTNSSWRRGLKAYKAYANQLKKLEL